MPYLTKMPSTFFNLQSRATTPPLRAIVSSSAASELSLARAPPRAALSQDVWAAAGAYALGSSM